MHRPCPRWTAANGNRRAPPRLVPSNLAHAKSKIDGRNALALLRRDRGLPTCKTVRGLRWLEYPNKHRPDRTAAAAAAVQRLNSRRARQRTRRRKTWDKPGHTPPDSHAAPA